jgi:hypothetical protein
MGISRHYKAPRIQGPDEGRFSILRILLLMLLVAGAGWAGYQLAGSGVDPTLIAVDPDAKEQIKELEAERDEMLRRIAMAEQSANMDKLALKAVKREFKKLQTERQKLEEELAFLSGIVSTDSKSAALRVQQFKLKPSGEAQAYTYRFTVSQVINSGIIAKGAIHLKVNGSINGENRELGLDSLTKEKKKSIKMRFKYYQNVEGSLKLPDGFSPTKLTIEVKPTNNKLAPVTMTYDWQPMS